MLWYKRSLTFQANLFDLTPKNTAGKYTAKKGVDGIDGLLHKVFKIAKLYQPSVVFIDDAGSIFAKKACHVFCAYGGAAYVLSRPKMTRTTPRA